MIEASSRILDWIGAGLLVFVFLVLVYGIIYIHDIPYKLAKERNHPHQDAIHAAGWLSLFLLHVIWPFLWIWALLYKPGVSTKTNEMLKHGFAESDELTQAIDNLGSRLTALEGRLDSAAPASTNSTDKETTPATTSRNATKQGA